jgi:hypothetical protein
MDPVGESQGSFNKLLTDEVNYSDEGYWVEAAWRRDDAADVSQDDAGRWRDGVGVKCVELHQEDLSRPAESVLETLPEEEGIEVALVATERRLSCLKTQLHTAQKSCQSTSSKDNRFVVERANFRYVAVITLLSLREINSSQIIHLPKAL